jgi:hypothetical protein
MLRHIYAPTPLNPRAASVNRANVRLAFTCSRLAQRSAQLTLVLTTTQIFAFSQREYTSLLSPASLSMGNTGYVYVPTACQKGACTFVHSGVLACLRTQCCKTLTARVVQCANSSWHSTAAKWTSPRSRTPTTSTQASTNGPRPTTYHSTVPGGFTSSCHSDTIIALLQMIVLYPQAIVSSLIPYNPKACWDWCVRAPPRSIAPLFVWASQPPCRSGGATPAPRTPRKPGSKWPPSSE